MNGSAVLWNGNERKLYALYIRLFCKRTKLQDKNGVGIRVIK